MPRKVIATLMIAAGVVALISIVRYPTEPRWQADDPARGGHVTSMAWLEGGLVLAQQDGRVWERRDGTWAAMPELPEDARSTVLFAGDDLLAGTTDGIRRFTGDGWEAITGDNAPSGRISYLTGLGERTYVAGYDGVWTDQGDGEWRALGRPDPDAPVYRVLVTDDDNAGEPLLRSGSIEAGVHIHDADAETWKADNDGLPDAVKVLSFYQLTTGTVLAGTDEGLFRQDAPFEGWTRVGGLLGERRILSMAATEEELYVGSDDGAWRAPLDDGGIDSQPGWLPVPTAEDALDAPVAWIIIEDDTPWIAAGTAYKLRSGRTPEWYLLVIGAPLLLVGGAGLWLYPR